MLMNTSHRFEMRGCHPRGGELGGRIKLMKILPFKRLLLVLDENDDVLPQAQVSI